MTEKELLYLEDAVSHESIIISICEDMEEKIEDEDLKSFITSEIEKHTSIKDELMNFMEEKVNEW